MIIRSLLRAWGDIPMANRLPGLRLKSADEKHEMLGLEDVETRRT